MNTVTFETAKRLKDAGFPQPKPVPGQFWYNGKDELLCIQNTSDDTAHFFGVGNNRFVFNASFAHLFDALFFAPTATDILEKTAFVSGDFVEVEARVLPNGFCVDVFEGLLFGKMKPVQIFDTNPHEAAAKAFLELKKAGK